MGKFTGYTYEQYQNEMCDRAIENNKLDLVCYLYGIGKLHTLNLSEKEAENVRIHAKIYKYTFSPVYVGQTNCENAVKRLEKHIEYLTKVRESNGRIIEPLYMSYWKNVYAREA